MSTLSLKQNYGQRLYYVHVNRTGYETHSEIDVRGRPDGSCMRDMKWGYTVTSRTDGFNPMSSDTAVRETGLHHCQQNKRLRIHLPGDEQEGHCGKLQVLFEVRRVVLTAFQLP